ncbi:DUF5420 family protein [Pasteurella bettyae]|uniref:DUF5420 family protein n=1 Tax=Pasteurella bettyae TaxID=752 RepID=UPI003D29A55C
MQFRFYKGYLNQEPLKTIYQKWLEGREARNKELETIFNTIPFYDGWLGSETSIFGIVCKRDESVLAEVKETKGYKVEIANDKTVIKPDKRYKVGKELDTKLNQCWQILQRNPDFSKFSLKELGIYIMTPDATNLHFSVAGIAGSDYIAKIPVPNSEHSCDKFPEIPDCLIKIKESEFLALQGK